ncbi:hypothetical protein CDV36_011813 [Fusarium kuroshium]|uniref:Uncharacterized protein n=1 Tax=Fusarium kuroshium TaxID=2010991 RepID=A0A3M2RTD9_9HYPO|nr:hypothetical protein CDV36_011813 [Fusarium kuroshium]
MANGFDRLERFFAKKKTPTASADQVGPMAQAVAPPTIPQFPSPSFIRPKTSRMAAREEVRKQPAGRVPSFPTPISPQRMDFSNAHSPTRSSNSSQAQYSPLKTTFMPTETDSFLDSFDVYQFPRPPTHSGETSTLSTCEPKSSIEAPSERSFRPRSLDKGDDVLRLDTPPSSDLDDDDIRGPRHFLNKELPALPQRKPPTPDTSPELRPIPDSQLRGSKSIDFLNKAVYKDIRRQLAESLDQQSLRRTASQSSLAPSSSRLSLSSSTLREPDFHEFLNLSDDDIAESGPEGLEDLDDSPTSSTAPSTVESPRQSLLTLTPPYASKPAEAAAFEARRIANRYNFDFVYVVNLWPGHARSRTSDSDRDVTSFNPLSSGKQQKTMAGRLLAAYGLETVKSPFQICPSAHGKILRTPGWTEYRPTEIRDDEFARGYACAFYTGEYSRAESDISRHSASSAPSMKTDRGIVFAAYRTPRVDGSMVGIGSSPAELASIHKDAEALVELLIDTHVANRLRQPQHQSHHSEETGPMPRQRLGVL